MTPALLDTHVLLWWIAGDSRLTRAQRRILAAAGGDAPLLVAEISLWEVATLVDLGRVELDLPVRDWLEKATALPLVRRVGVTPAIAAETMSLPAGFHRDPADRLIVATARILGARLLTTDRRIIESGAVATVY